MPPRWIAQLVALAVMLVALPLLTPFEWTDAGIPVPAAGVAYFLVFYVAVFWIGHASNRSMDGRSWSSATGPRFVLAIIVVAVVVTGVFNTLAPRVLFTVPRVTYFVAAALVLAPLVYVLIKRNNPVRFPPHARHLNRLRWGPLAGRPPASESRQA